MKILDRLKKLEQRRTESHAAIFYSIYDREPLGWSYDADGQRYHVNRLPDETDGELRGRAAAACRAACPGSVPILFQIDDDFENVGNFILPKVIEPGAWECKAAEQQDALTRQTHR